MIIPVGSALVGMVDEGDRVCAHMASGGTFEPCSLEAWGRLCTAARGRTVVDAGCYTGLYAISAAMLGCKVVAFEPMLLNVRRIVINAHANGVREAIQIYKGVALSDRIGEAPINFNPAVRGLTSGASLVNEKLGRHPIKKVVVKVTTLDSLGLEDVAAMKIDVERAEPEVLRGARETIARCKPTILIEVLTAKIGAAARDLLPDYAVAEIDDGPGSRNWLMTPL